MRAEDRVQHGFPKAIMFPLFFFPPSSGCRTYLLEGLSENACDAKSLSEEVGLRALSWRLDGSDCPRKDAFSLTTIFFYFYFLMRGEFRGWLRVPLVG